MIHDLALESCSPLLACSKAGMIYRMQALSFLFLTHKRSPVGQSVILAFGDGSVLCPCLELSNDVEVANVDYRGN